MKWVVDRFAARKSKAEIANIGEKGTLLASGLIAGEAILGILLAVVFVAGISSITHLLFGVDQFSFLPAWGGWLSLVAFAAIAYVLIRIPLRRTT